MSCEVSTENKNKHLHKHVNFQNLLEIFSAFDNSKSIMHKSNAQRKNLIYRIYYVAHGTTIIYIYDQTT